MTERPMKLVVDADGAVRVVPFDDADMAQMESDQASRIGPGAPPAEPGS